MRLSRAAAAAAITGFVLSGLALSGGPVAAGSAPYMFPAEERAVPYSGDLPACDDPGILSAIKDQFDSKLFWFGDSDITIDTFDVAQTREVGYRKHGSEFIPRRYCEIRTIFTDGRAREVKYNIIEHGGFASFGPGIEFCAVGEDPARAYPPHCSLATR